MQGKIKTRTSYKILIILLLAATIRVIGIWHGYPYSYYPDEAHFVKRALSFGTFDFNPHWFHKPAFYMYLLFFEYGMFFIFGKLMNIWNSVSEFATFYILNPGPFYLIGRLTTTAFGVGTVWLVYRSGERHFKKSVGLIGALLLALSSGHVMACRDVKADIPATFFAFASMYFLLSFLTEKKSRDLLYAAALAGLGTATKYYPIVMLLPIVGSIIGIAINHHDEFIKKVKYVISFSILAVSTFWMVHFVSAPYNFLDPLGCKATFKGISRLTKKLFVVLEINEVSASKNDFISQPLNFFEGLSDYFQVFLATNGTGFIIGVFALIGFFALLARNRTCSRVIFLSYPFIFFLTSVFVYPGYAQPRHQLPIYPFLAVAGGYFIVQLAGTTFLRKKVIYGTMLVLLCWPLIDNIQQSLYIAKIDTRNLAKDWIEDNIPADSKLLIDENGVKLLTSKSVILDKIAKTKNADPNGQFTAHFDRYLGYQLQAAEKEKTYSIDEIRFPWWRESWDGEQKQLLDSDYDRDMGNPLKEVGVNSYQYYVDNGYKYAIVHSDEYKAYFKPHSEKAQKYPSFAQFYYDLFKHGFLIKEFLPQDGNRPGPVVKIFKFSKEHGL